MKTTTYAKSFGRWCFLLMMHDCCGIRHQLLFQSRYGFRQRRHTMQPQSQPQSSVIPPSMNSKRQRYDFCLKIYTIDVDIPDEGERKIKHSRENQLQQRNDDPNRAILSWNDILPLSMYVAACLVGAIVISTYEDYDVTHTRPSPSTLRLPTLIITSESSSSSSVSLSPWRRSFNFIGAATRGMAWGPSNRSITIANSEATSDMYSFEEWYGTSATTLQWKPSYNEIMLQHRLERVPRWNKLGNEQTTKPLDTKHSVTPTKEQLKQAVSQLYDSIDELENLKLMADNYMWDEIKEHLRPTPNTLASITATRSEYPLPVALEYSMDVLKSIPSHYPSSTSPNNVVSMSKHEIRAHHSNKNLNELPNIIGFDWGSCAWRHCGAKADAQEAIAELYSNVGMLEPFECRFILDVVERSIRDVIDVIPDELKPYEDGAVVRLKPYEPYISLNGGNDGDGIMGIDYEYTKALSKVRVDLSLE